jgi:CubicO group peptidase (beta-lactamase class C family)
MNNARKLLAILFLFGCAPRAVSPPPPCRIQTRGLCSWSPGGALTEVDVPASLGLEASLPATLDSIIGAAIKDGASPGVVVAVGRDRGFRLIRAYGKLDWAPDAEPATQRSLYDLASLTKVVATTTAAMILEESGKLDIDRTVASYLPEFNAPDKSSITIRQLLTHRGGMEAFSDLWRTTRGREEYLNKLNVRPLAYAPGTKMIYSDWDMVLLQLVIERISGTSLDAFVDSQLFKPLHMSDTRFQPPPELRSRIAATEVDSLRGGLLRGIVHDENAWALGGVSGNAGLFSTARDLSIFAEMMLNDGEIGGVRIVKPSTIAQWTARQDKSSSRALGWDTPSPQSSAGHYFSPRSFGHTGFTGTSIWIDPEKRLYLILLTNRVDPTRNNTKVGPLRRAVADAVQRAIIGAPVVDWEAKQ